MRLLLAAGAALFFFCSSVWAGTQPGSELVRIEGKQFVAPTGEVLHIKAINLGNWLMPEGYMFKFEVAKSPRQIYDAFDRILGEERAALFWTEFRNDYVAQDDIRFIKSVGFNAVRVPLHWQLFMDEDGKIGGDGWALLDRLLGWLKEEGLYAIVDLHAAPGGQTGINHDDGPGYPLMFYVPRDRQLTVKLWHEIAKHYAGNPTILGYDLLNEPIAPYHDIVTLNPKLEPFYKELTQAIRSVDPDRIVFLAAAQWSSRFDMLGAPFAPNLAYTYHAFWASTRRDSIQRHLNFANLYNVPLFLGESGELDDEWNEGFRKLHEAMGVSWSFWTFKNLDTPSTVASIPRPEGWDALAAYADGRGPRPSEEEIDRTIAQYLDGIRFRNVNVRWSYLASLGLKSQPDALPVAGGDRKSP